MLSQCERNDEDIVYVLTGSERLGGQTLLSHPLYLSVSGAHAQAVLPCKMDF